MSNLIGTILGGVLRGDGWQNIITGLGVEGKDSRISNAHRRTLVLTPTELESLHAENPIAGRIIDLPIDEALREGVELTSPEGDDDTAGVLDELAQMAQERDAWGQLAEAARWGELYGGAVAVLGVEDGQPADQPINWLGVRDLHWIKPLDRWSVSYDPSRPDHYTINDAGTPDALAELGMGHRVHRERVIRFGSSIPTPPRLRVQYQGWDIPKLTRIYNALSIEGTAFDAAGSSVQRTSQAVYKMKNLAAKVQQNGLTYVRNRLAAHVLTQSFLNAIFVDSDGEDFEHKSLPVAGLADLLDRFPTRVAAAAGMPMSLLYGAHPGGFSNEDRSGERYFYAWVKSMIQVGRLEPAMMTVLKILMAMRQGPTGGQQIGVGIAWPALWTPTPLEAAQIYKTNAEGDAANIAAGVLLPGEVSQSRFGGRTYSAHITLDQEAREQASAESGSADLTPEQKLQQARLALPLLYSPVHAQWAAEILGAPAPTEQQIAEYAASSSDGSPATGNGSDDGGAP